VEEHGEAKAKALVPLAIKHMKTKWPNAKSFNAIGKYLGEAIKDYEREKAQKEWEHQELACRRQEREEEKQRQEIEQQMAVLWETLPIEERSEIEQAILADNPFLKNRKGHRFVHLMCLSELAKRRKVIGSGHQTA
jgi:hypothetical protein